ncbi:cysteine methyltransferase [Alteromonas sp. MYP5]|uniref:Cysteine methyltransferase n=2 Tax=Alteromonas ponticola TaxID=2720613 RepID=A0ABX1R2G6_9ALTE|nr:cysteine methyltransferase [Alteromonas ponticola]
MAEKQQYQIYHTINLIPEGKVASYGQIADLAGLPRRARLVGYYLKHCQATENLKWHRVIKSSGQIAFPPGSERAKVQSENLAMEGVVVKNGRVNMKKYQWTPDITDILYKLKF